MNSRERVHRSLDHQEPDRVPLALGGGSYGIVDDLYLRLVKLLEMGSPVPPFRSGHSISYMDDRLLARLGIDCRYCWPGLLPNSPVVPGKDENTFYDSFGQMWIKALPYYFTGKGILSDAITVEDIDKNLKTLDLSDPRWVAGLFERARALAEGSEYFVVMRMVASHGPFQTACDFRGTENFLTDMALNPEFAEALLDRVTTSIVGLLELSLKTAGKYFDMIELPGDDYAGNTNTIVSPRMFRKFIQPCLKRLVNCVKEYNPNLKVMLHSDGAITSLIPDIIALGVDVIHPLEPLASTDIPAVKANFGQQISFLGGIDITHAMPGSQADIIDEVKTRLKQLANGGGYVMAPSNHLQADIPAENVLTLYDQAKLLGKYPIRIPD